MTDRLAQLLSALLCGGLGFDSRAGQIEHSVANGLPTLRHFYRAVLPKHKAAEMRPATRYTPGRNTASIMKVSFSFNNTNIQP